MQILSDSQFLYTFNHNQFDTGIATCVDFNQNAKQYMTSMCIQMLKHYVCSMYHGKEQTKTHKLTYNESYYMTLIFWGQGPKWKTK